MKCIKSTTGSIVRATDKEAQAMVSGSNWVYCSKTEWKTKVRDAEKESPKKEKKEKLIKPVSLETEVTPNKYKKGKRKK